jgi:HAD superfamily hydrolase (TIGR01549 family)
VRPKAVLFDAGNTLLFLDYPRMAAAVSAATGVPLTGEVLAAQASAAARVMEEGKSTDRERAGRYLKALFELAGVPPSQSDLVRDTLLALHKEKHLWAGAQEGTFDALDRLVAAGIRMAVISNSDGRADEGLRAAGLLDRFEFVIDSQLVGFEKPDPRIFAAALERLGLSPEESVYVGDLYEVDVVGARAAGMDVILLDPLAEHAGRGVRTARDVAGAVDLILGSRV